MAYARVTYTGNGVQTTFTYPFTLLPGASLIVTVNGSHVPFERPSPGQVRITPAPAAGAVVEIRRSTSLTEPMVDFTNGSTLIESDLDNAILHPLHAAQEVMDEIDPMKAFIDLNRADILTLNNTTSGLQTQISYEASVRSSADSAIHNRIDQEVNDLTAYIQNGDNTLNTRITNEVSTLNSTINSKESLLQSQINAVNSDLNSLEARVDNMETGSGAVPVPIPGVDNGKMAVIENDAWVKKDVAQLKLHFGLGTAAGRDVGTTTGTLVLRENFGSAAWKNVGTGAGDIPVRGDFGTAAFQNVGTNPNDLVQRSHLGSAAFLNAGTSANSLVQLPSNSTLPALSGINLLDVVHHITVARYIEARNPANNAGDYPTANVWRQSKMNTLLESGGTGVSVFSEGVLSLPPGRWFVLGFQYAQDIGMATLKVCGDSDLATEFFRGPLTNTTNGAMLMACGLVENAVPSWIGMATIGNTANPNTNAFGQASASPTIGSSQFAQLILIKIS